MNEEGAHIVRTWLVLAAIAGAITGTLQQKGLSMSGRLAAFFIGLTAALFCSEYVLAWFGLEVDTKAAFMVYLIGVCSNSVIPNVIRRVSNRFNDPLSLTNRDQGL